MQPALHPQLSISSYSWRVKCVLSPTACLSQHGTGTAVQEEKESVGNRRASPLAMPIKRFKIIHCCGVSQSPKLVPGTAAVPSSRQGLSLHL